MMSHDVSLLFLHRGLPAIITSECTGRFLDRTPCWCVVQVQGWSLVAKVILIAHTVGRPLKCIWLSIAIDLLAFH